MESGIKLISRQSIAAGRFYSANPNKLELEIKELLNSASLSSEKTLPENEKLLSLIAPHAGYVFSGVVSASAFLQLRNISPRKKVFLLGSSHHTDFNGASIYNIGDYNTPFGNVKVDIETANKLIAQSELINFVQSAHAHEHSLEVMLPFLQYCWNNNFEIIPIILATHDVNVCKSLAETLKPYFNKENLFVISTDLSHYPTYSNAIETDRKTVNSVLTGNPENLINQIEENKLNFIQNLATSMCGWTSVLTIMYITSALNKNIRYYPILYKNSGDAKLYGDQDRVVGYQSIGIYYE